MIELDGAAAERQIEVVPPVMGEFLTWLAARPRTYGDVMDAWQTSCPRSSVWEDSLADGLVERLGRSRDAVVALTERGRLIVFGAA